MKRIKLCSQLILEDDDNIRVVFEKHYSCFRSFRRTSNSRALENRDGLHDDDIDIVNRWRQAENAKGKHPTHVMQQHYVEMDVLLQPFLRYTRAM